MASWPPWRRMATVFQPIKPVPPITTILIASLLVRGPQAGVCDGCAESHHQRVLSTIEGVRGAPFHSMTLSVTTRRQAILTRASALSKRQPERPRCMQGTMCRAVSPAVSDGKCFSEAGVASRGILRETSPSRLRLRRRVSTTAARGRGRGTRPRSSRDHTLREVGSSCA